VVGMDLRKSNSKARGGSGWGFRLAPNDTPRGQKQALPRVQEESRPHPRALNERSVSPSSSEDPAEVRVELTALAETRSVYLAGRSSAMVSKNFLFMANAYGARAVGRAQLLARLFCAGSDGGYGDEYGANSFFCVEGERDARARAIFGCAPGMARFRKPGSPTMQTGPASVRGAGIRLTTRFMQRRPSCRRSAESSGFSRLSHGVLAATIFFFSFCVVLIVGCLVVFCFVAIVRGR